MTPKRFWSRSSLHAVLYMNVNYRKYACALFVHNKRAMGKNVHFIKGQLISEQICGVLNFPKMQRNIARISALTSKKKPSFYTFLHFWKI